MVAEIELKAFNQIGQGNFAATVAEIQLIELWIDERSTERHAYWCEISKNLLRHLWDDQLSSVGRDVKDWTLIFYAVSVKAVPCYYGIAYIGYYEWDVLMNKNICIVFRVRAVTLSSSACFI